MFETFSFCIIYHFFLHSGQKHFLLGIFLIHMHLKWNQIILQELSSHIIRLSSVSSILHMHQVSFKLVSFFLFGFVKYLVVSSGKSTLQKRFFALLIISAWMSSSFSIIICKLSQFVQTKKSQLETCNQHLCLHLIKLWRITFKKNSSIFLVIYIRIFLANNIRNIIISVRIWAFNLKATFSTTRTSNNTVSRCANIWPFRIYDKPRFSDCEIALVFFNFGFSNNPWLALQVNAPVCGYFSKFMSVANFFINDKDELSIFALIPSFMLDAVIRPALNLYHLLLFAWFLVRDSMFNASFCVIVNVS